MDNAATTDDLKAPADKTGSELSAILTRMSYLESQFLIDRQTITILKDTVRQLRKELDDVSEAQDDIPDPVDSPLSHIIGKGALATHRSGDNITIGNQDCKHLFDIYHPKVGSKQSLQIRGPSTGSKGIIIGGTGVDLTSGNFDTDITITADSYIYLYVNRSNNTASLSKTTGSIPAAAAAEEIYPLWFIPFSGGKIMWHNVLDLRTRINQEFRPDAIKGTYDSQSTDFYPTGSGDRQLIVFGFRNPTFIASMSTDDSFLVRLNSGPTMRYMKLADLNKLVVPASIPYGSIDMTGSNWAYWQTWMAHGHHQHTEYNFDDHNLSGGPSVGYPSYIVMDGDAHRNCMGGVIGINVGGTFVPVIQPVNKGLYGVKIVGGVPTPYLSLDWNSLLLNDSAGKESVDWGLRQLYDKNGTALLKFYDNLSLEVLAAAYFIVSNTTDAVALGAGAITCAGGASIQKKLQVGDSVISGADVKAGNMSHFWVGTAEGADISSWVTGGVVTGSGIIEITDSERLPTDKILVRR